MKNFLCMLIILVSIEFIYCRVSEQLFRSIQSNLSKYRQIIDKDDLHYANGVMHLEIDGRRTNINSQMLIGYYAIGLAISRMNINCTEIEIIISYTIKEKFQIVSRADINLVEKLTKGRISSEQFLSQINY